MKNKFNIKFLEKRYVLLLALFISVSFSFYLYYTKENQLFPRATLYFMEEVKLPEKGQKVLVFSPHPDDETIGAGGLIYESLRKGAEVKIVLVTDGNKHGLKNKRYAEFENSTSILGVKKENLEFLDYPDGGLQSADKVSLKEKFKKIITDYNPNYVVYPYIEDQHLDHSTTGKVVHEILDNSPKYKSYQYLVHHKYYPYPHRFRPEDYMLPPVSLVSKDQKWVNLMLSSEAKDDKMEAVLGYKTQLKYISLRELLYSFIRKNEVYSVKNED